MAKPLGRSARTPPYTSLRYRLVVHRSVVSSCLAIGEMPTVLGMSDEPERIRELGRHAARLATDARHAATTVSSRTAVQWHSQGADRYRKKLSDRAAEFRRRADDLDRLSRLLFSHARHVEDHEELLSQPLELAKQVGKAADAVKKVVPWV